MNLRDIEELLSHMPGDFAVARRKTISLERQAALLAEETLISGAMPDDFRIVHVIRIGKPWGTLLA